jgi:hypothetical protein
LATSGSTAILLFDYMVKKKRVSLSPVFNRCSVRWTQPPRQSSSSG